jgi:hypothetical protein
MKKQFYQKKGSMHIFREPSGLSNLFINLYEGRSIYTNWIDKILLPPAKIMGYMSYTNIFVEEDDYDI